jgi:hypothetical protein
MRGKKPNVTIGRAKKFAERQGYRWVSNPDADMPFDALVYRGNDMIVVRIRTSRNAPGDYDLFEDFFKEEFKILNALPFPSYLAREIWVRYTWSRNFHRFRILRDKFVETSMIDREKPVFEMGKEYTDSPSKMPVAPGHEVR